VSGILDGIRVMDFTRWQQGPSCTIILSDMGAEVWKIEALEGDPSRGITKYAWDDPGPNQGIDNAYFLGLNRNKKSIAVNLKHPRAKEVILKMAEIADVCVHNFRQGVMKRLGLGYEELCQRNPKIIYAAGSGYGRKGPRRSHPAFDLAAQAMSGIMSLTGEKEGYPLHVGVAIADQTGGTHLALGILAALYYRERTGVGQQLDISLLGGQIFLQSWEIDMYTVTGESTTTGGRFNPYTTGIYAVYKARDKYFVIGGVWPEQWEGLCRALGMPQLIDDPRFSTPAERAQNHDELTSILDKVFLEKTVDEWLQILAELDIIAAPVYTHAEVVNDPQVLENGYIWEDDHPTLGRIKVAGFPIEFSKTPAKIQRPPPYIGEHTEEILLTLGYSKADIEGLKSQKAVR